jgi:hypothetical protein
MEDTGTQIGLPPHSPPLTADHFGICGKNRRLLSRTLPRCVDTYAQGGGGVCAGALRAVEGRWIAFGLRLLVTILLIRDTLGANLSLALLMHDGILSILNYSSDRFIIGGARYETIYRLAYRPTYHPMIEAISSPCI